MKSRVYVVALSAACAAVGAQGAQAAQTFGLTDTIGWTGTGDSTITPTNHPIVTDSNVSATVNSVVPTVSYGLSDAFNELVSTGTPLANEFPTPSVAANKNNATGHWNFYDNYVFSLNTGATVQSALISFTLPSDTDPGGLVGVSNLQARIIQLSPSPNPSYQNGTYDSLYNTQPGVLSQLGNATASIIDGWVNTSTTIGDSNYYRVMLNKTPFSGGLYALQIRGLVAQDSGLFSGSYGGSISFTPVPLPAGVWLLGAGLLGIGRLIRRPQPEGLAPA
ncbi:MAG TPA: hypothetical protein VJQ47_05230 [Steroidobacteraceae bacterium]|nr:hypothetical protein [Steroidobacteraceae bacterium]